MFLGFKRLFNKTMNFEETRGKAKVFIPKRIEEVNCKLSKKKEKKSFKDIKFDGEH